MKIRTTYNPPPGYPWKDLAWSAIDDDTYEGGSPIGYGATEKEAIRDLEEKLAEHAGLEWAEWIRTVAT